MCTPAFDLQLRRLCLAAFYIPQSEGRYKVAHDMLLDAWRRLESLRIEPPLELSRSLALLHSYILVKTHVALGDHGTAARLLVRVARDISKFPRHVVPILTSTVIECHRSGLRRTAFEYASLLMRQEHRNEVCRQPSHSLVKLENCLQRLGRKQLRSVPATGDGLVVLPCFVV